MSFLLVATAWITVWITIFWENIPCNPPSDSHVNRELIVMNVPHVVHVHVTVTWDCFINKTNSRCSHLSLSACTLLHCAARYGSAHWKALEHPADGVTQTHSQQLLQEREPFYVQITAVIRLIVINRIQNKSFCLHIISVFTVYIYYVYKYKHMHVYIYIKEKYVYINIHSTHTYIVQTNVFILDAINRN